MTLILSLYVEVKCFMGGNQDRRLGVAERLGMFLIISTFLTILSNGVSANPEPWYNDPTRPRTLHAVFAFLRVHVEHFTRLTADEINILVESSPSSPAWGVRVGNHSAEARGCFLSHPSDG